MIVTTCKVHGELTIEFTSRHVVRGKQYYRCAQCARKRVAAYKRKYYERDRIKNATAVKAWKERNKEKVLLYDRKYSKKYREANPEKVKATFQKCQQFAVREASDSYIKILLKRDGILSNDNFPSSLIELKRAQLKLKRKIKELKGNQT